MLTNAVQLGLPDTVYIYVKTHQAPAVGVNRDLSICGTCRGDCFQSEILEGFCFSFFLSSFFEKKKPNKKQTLFTHSLLRCHVDIVYG